MLGAVGILVLRFSGQPMPPFPPALVLLVGAAALVAAAQRRRAAVAAVPVAVAEIAGFVLTGGLSDLLGAGSVGVVAGGWVRAIGIAVATAAGIVARSRRGRCPSTGGDASTDRTTRSAGLLTG